MRQTQQMRNASFRHQAEYVPRRTPMRDGALVLWTPMTPPEIAEALRPYVVSQPGRTYQKPLLYGKLGQHGMSIERRRSGAAAYPRLNVEYEVLSEGTMQFGKVAARRPRGSTLFLVSIMSGVVATIPAYRISPPAAVAFGIVTAIMVGVMLSFALTRPIFGASLAWYRRLLLDVLRAENVGGRA